MRLTSGLAAATALLTCNLHLAAATTAYVFTFEPESASSKHKISLTGLSPSTARVVLAQRAGVENFHSTHGLTQEEINAVNSYGLQTNLFDSRSSRRRAFLLAPLDAEAEANPRLRTHSRFSVNNPPSFTDTTELFSDLLDQAEPESTRAKADLHDESAFKSASADVPWFHIAPDAATLIELASKLSKEQVTVTALLIPEGERKSSWGLYESARKSATMSKRQVPHRLQDEEPMTVNSAPASPMLQMQANSSNSSSNYTNTPLPGILPACYSSKRSCESTTRSCTGHGSCVLKYTDKTKKQNSTASEPGACWGCRCGTTKNNGLTTYWAGPACQKKDISVEFWLLALFTVGLLSLVTFAVGTIWNMGEEQLPSVIGAGVSGPTAKK